MKKFALCFVLCLIPLAAWAASTGLLEKDLNFNVIQADAPNGMLSQQLTVNTATVDLTNSLWWELYSPTACKYRIMDTSDKTGHPQFSTATAERIQHHVNKATPFLNLSGCTNGELLRQ